MKSLTSTAKRKDEETLLKALAAEAPVGICIMQAGRFCYVNSYFPIAIGYSVDELIGRDSLDIVVPEDREMVNKNTRRMLEGELSSPYQFRVNCKDGSIVWVMATVRSIDYHGKQAILGSYMEVTERTKIANALRDSEEQYRLLANSITDVFFAMDEGLRYTYWNKASEILTGILAKDAVGKSIQEVFPDTPWRRKAEKVYRQVLNTQQFQTFVNHYDHNGRDYVFEISVYPSRGGISVLVKDVTEHKHAEGALKLQKAYFQQLFDSSPDAIAMLDTDTKVVQANEAFERLFGYSLEEIKGRAIKELIVPKDRLEETSAVSRTIFNGQVFRKEFVRIRKDGSPIDVSLVAYPIRLDGNVVGIYSIYSDITKRKRMEQTLREAEEEKSTLLEEAPVSIIHADLNGRITYVNKRFEVESGYLREEVIGKIYFELGWFSGDTTKYLAERMAARLRGEAAKHWETQFRCKDGHWIWIELEGKVISRLGAPVGYQIVASNVTERKEAAEALRQSEEKYRTILEEMEDAYFEVDLGGHLTFVNNSVCRDLGYSREELVGMSYKAFTAANDIDSVFRVFNEVYRTGVPNKGFPWKTIRKDGVQGFAETSIAPLRDHRGETIGFRGVGRDITERKQTEEKLRQSRENYRALFDSSVIGALVVDAETMKVVMANQATLKMFGFSSPEEGVNPLDFVPAEDRDKNLGLIMKELFQKDSRGSVDLPVITKDGRKMWVSVTGARIMHKGKPAALLSFTDITERRKVEEALQQSEKNYRALFDSSVIGTFVLDAETRKAVMANEAAAKIFGFGSSEEGIGEDPLEYVHPAEKDRALDLIVRELFEQDLRASHEIRATTKDGRQIWISVTAAKIMHAGKLANLISFTDITERKRTEEALRQSEENYRVLFDNQVIGSVVLDAETMKIVMVNSAALRIFGFSSAEQAFEAEPFDFILSDDKERYLDITKTAVFEQNSHEGYQVRALTRDGREVWINTTATKIVHKGRPAALISFTDITEQRRQRERLMMTDRMASLGELAAGTAHELNNPLTSILGFSQLLMEKKVPDEIREDVKIIYSEAQRAANVTKDLLTFARKQAPVKQLNQINSVVEDVLELRAYVHEMNGIEVKKHLARDLPELMVDYFQMQQVFLNIIINAEYFMSEAHNGGTLTITTKKQNGAVVIAIADDGPGIPPENLKRIFDPFFTTKEAGKGTGLGLSICHGIVTEHGGQIYVKSELGKGAVVLVEIPVKSQRPDSGLL